MLCEKGNPVARREAQSRGPLYRGERQPGSRTERQRGGAVILVAQAAKGDLESFARIVRKHSTLIYRIALWMLGAEEAQEVTKEVWLRVWRNLESCRYEGASTFWLYKITVSTCPSKRHDEDAPWDRRGLGDEFRYLPKRKGQMST